MPFTYKRTEAYQGQLFNPATFQPLEDQVLVLPDDAPAMRGVIHIPESARVEKNERGYPVFYRTGVVVKVGPGDKDLMHPRRVERCDRCGREFPWPPRIRSEGPQCCGMAANSIVETRYDRLPMDLKPGDHILYLVRPGSEVVFEGKEYMVLHEDAEYGQHVLGVLED